MTVSFSFSARIGFSLLLILLGWERTEECKPGPVDTLSHRLDTRPHTSPHGETGELRNFESGNGDFWAEWGWCQLTHDVTQEPSDQDVTPWCDYNWQDSELASDTNHQGKVVWIQLCSEKHKFAVYFANWQWQVHVHMYDVHVIAVRKSRPYQAIIFFQVYMHSFVNTSTRFIF